MNQSSPGQTPAHEPAGVPPELAFVSMSETTARRPYARPQLTEHGRVPAMTLADASSVTSDRNVKERFEAVDPQVILAAVATLPIERWSYKREPVRHLGPMAQDFTAAFGLGADDRHIFPLDAAGVALAAIQELQALARAQASRLDTLERELTALRSETTSLQVELALHEREPIA